MGAMTAVFVHGVPETPAVWRGLRAALDRPDTVALSLPGFDSARPAGFGATMEEYADWLAAQLVSIPFVASKQLGDSNLWMPIAPQTVWHMRQSIEYSMTANRAILDFASRYREKVLYDVYRMGRDEIQWGSEDHWTFSPHKMARVQDGLVARGAATATAIPGRRPRRLPPRAAVGVEVVAGGTAPIRSTTR